MDKYYTIRIRRHALPSDQEIDQTLERKNTVPINEKSYSRRWFLKTAGTLAVSTLVSAACGSINTAPAESLSTTSGTAANAKTLKIAQQTHFVPAYDEWFAKDFAAKWGQQNGVAVSVDFYPSADLYSRAAGEVAVQTGHDLFGFTSPSSVFEKETVDLKDVVTELESKYGPMAPLARQSVYNPKTQKWVGLSDYYVPAPPIYRPDLWQIAEPGSTPDAWEDILRVGRKLKANGSPVGIGLSPEFDSNTALRGLLYSYGATEMDEAGKIAINSPQTIEAIKLGTALFREAMTPEVLSWSSSSNNQFLLSGTGSLVMNGISVIRTAEKSNPNLGKKMAIWKAAAGPVRRLLPTNIINSYALWKFSPSIDLAKKFLIDLIGAHSTAFTKSELYNIPSFPGAAPNYKDLYKKDAAGDPPDKYSVLETTSEWLTNFGYPGFSNAAISESIDMFVIVRMFAMAATGEMKPEDAAKWAEKELKRIVEKWTAKGLI